LLLLWPMRSAGGVGIRRHLAVGALGSAAHSPPSLPGLPRVGRDLDNLEIARPASVLAGLELHFLHGVLRGEKRWQTIRHLRVLRIFFDIYSPSVVLFSTVADGQADDTACVFGCYCPADLGEHVRSFLCGGTKIRLTKKLHFFVVPPFSNGKTADDELISGSRGATARARHASKRPTNCKKLQFW